MQRLIKHRIIGAAKFGKILLGFYCAQGIPTGRADYIYIMVETMGYSPVQYYSQCFYSSV